MPTLIYKRTHPGDPDQRGQFGINGCMGHVRTWGFDAVIGVGGHGSEPRRYGLAGKVTWIGIGAHRMPGLDERGPIVTFDHFVLHESSGPELAALAPRLARHIYSRNVRTIMKGLDALEQIEVQRILDLARDAPPSGSIAPTVATACAPRKRPCHC